MTTNTLLILIGLNLCHFLGDYTHLSTKEMLAAKRIGKPLLPIMAHATVHAVLMAVFLLAFTDAYTCRAMLSLQFISHLGIDILKGKLNVWFPTLANPANKYHWYIFGADQFFHQLVIIIMTYYVTA